MKYRYALILYLAAFLLQPVLYGLFPSVGGYFNLNLCFTVVLTFVLQDTFPGLLLGPVFGLIQDIMYAQYIGPTALAVAVAAVVVFVVREYVNVENVVNEILIMIMSTWLYVSVCWLVYYIAGSPYSYVYALHTLLLQCIVNVAAGLVLYMALIKRVIKHRRDRYFR